MEILLQHCLNGLTTGALFALIALGYTMVYGIIELVNFAHGDLVTLGAFLALTLIGLFGLATAGPWLTAAGLVLIFIIVIVACGLLNFAVDRLVYKPLRNAPRLAPLVSAIGVSFVFMNIAQLWGGPADVSFPELLPKNNLLGAEAQIQITWPSVLVIGVTVPLMIGLTLFVKHSKLGTAMRATAQNPLAAQLMGIPSDRVIGATFLIGGGLAGSASIIYALYIGTINYQLGFQNGLYAFTAAVLGGIGKIPGAVLGGLIIGLVRALTSGYLGERWSSALVFVILIVILVFRPSGLLGDQRREKV